MSRKDVQHTDIDPSIESTHGFILFQHIEPNAYQTILSPLVVHTRAGTNCYIGL